MPPWFQVDLSKLTKSQKKRLKKKLAQQAKEKPVNGVDKAKVIWNQWCSFMIILVFVRGSARDVSGIKCRAITHCRLDCDLLLFK